jgi:predicted small metal-binding protein
MGLKIQPRVPKCGIARRRCFRCRDDAYRHLRNASTRRCGGSRCRKSSDVLRSFGGGTIRRRSPDYGALIDGIPSDSTDRRLSNSQNCYLRGCRSRLCPDAGEERFDMAQQFECTQQDCEFMVRANDEQEIVDMVQEHAQEKHGMSMDRNDVQGAIEQS